jgi:hypothetical protein
MLLKAVIILCGFPAIAGYAVYKSLPIFEYNYSYFPYVLAGLGVLAALAALYYIAVIITGSLSKRAKGKNTITVCTVALVAVGMLLTTGTWFAIDKYVPPILSGATQSTITYEQLKDDYTDKARVHAELLTGFIEMNIKNGRLSPEKADIYRREGYGNDEVKELISNSYNSMQYDGYESFNGMLVDMANGGRLTIPVLLHLLFDERNAPSYGFSGYEGEGRGEENKDAPISWSVLDLQGGVMTFSLDAGGLLPTDYTELLEWLMPALFGEGGMMEELLTAVESAIASDELVGAPIYVSIDYAANTLSISIESPNSGRGVYDYMSMAWLANNQLLVAVISIFPVRNACLMLGGLLALSGIALGIIRQKKYGANVQKGGK